MLEEISIKLSSSKRSDLLVVLRLALPGKSPQILCFLSSAVWNHLSLSHPAEKWRGRKKWEKYHQKVICNGKTGEITRKNVKPIVFDAINARAGTHQFTPSLNRHHKQARKRDEDFFHHVLEIGGGRERKSEWERRKKKIIRNCIGKKFCERVKFYTWTRSVSSCFLYRPISRAKKSIRKTKLPLCRWDDWSEWSAQNMKEASSPFILTKILPITGGDSLEKDASFPPY